MVFSSLPTSLLLFLPFFLPWGPHYWSTIAFTTPPWKHLRTDFPLHLPCGLPDNYEAPVQVLGPGLAGMVQVLLPYVDVGVALGLGLWLQVGIKGRGCEEWRAAEADAPADLIGPAHAAPLPNPRLAIKRTSSKQAVLEAQFHLHSNSICVSKRKEGWSIPFWYNWNNYP